MSLCLFLTVYLGSDIPYLKIGENYGLTRQTFFGNCSLPLDMRTSKAFGLSDGNESLELLSFYHTFFHHSHGHMYIYTSIDCMHSSNAIIREATPKCRFLLSSKNHQLQQT